MFCLKYDQYCLHMSHLAGILDSSTPGFLQACLQGHIVDRSERWRVAVFVMVGSCVFLSPGVNAHKPDEPNDKVRPCCTLSSIFTLCKYSKLHPNQRKIFLLFWELLLRSLQEYLLYIWRKGTSDSKKLNQNLYRHIADFGIHFLPMWRRKNQLNKQKFDRWVCAIFNYNIMLHARRTCGQLKTEVLKSTEYRRKKFIKNNHQQNKTKNRQRSWPASEGGPYRDNTRTKPGTK